MTSVKENLQHPTLPIDLIGIKVRQKQKAELKSFYA
jgi:hypothetical protein